MLRNAAVTRLLFRATRCAGVARLFSSIIRRIVLGSPFCFRVEHMKRDCLFESDDYTKECRANILRLTAGRLLADELTWGMVKTMEPEAA